jgi:hypothetical protein
MLHGVEEVLAEGYPIISWALQRNNSEQVLADLFATWTSADRQCTAYFVSAEIGSEWEAIPSPVGQIRILENDCLPSEVLPVKRAWLVLEWL